ncbi:TPA: addiction module toxin RelE [Klebsiella aerogenes]|uniref:addiction module toxin RelE n=1 Tax=Klebsiella sp. JN_Kp122 TaxID=3153435 RepID=UPI0027F4957A|nr:addiction module toxin RelE [Klebsiella aerogenes]
MPLVNKNNIIYTETFKFTVSNVLEFLSHHVDDPKKIIDIQLDNFEEKVCTFPEGCQIARDLSALGCSRYRECITKDGYRILYSYDEDSNQLTAHAILGIRQSVQQLLFDRLITI